jgi:hypothetical protein
MNTISNRYQALVDQLSKQGVVEVKAISVRPLGSAFGDSATLEAISSRYQAMVESFSGDGAASLIAISIRPLRSFDNKLSSLTGRYFEMVEALAEAGVTDLKAISIRYAEPSVTNQPNMSQFMIQYQDFADRFSPMDLGSVDGPLAISIRY